MHRYWNHNTRYHGALLHLLPLGCERVLDLGCGDGVFAGRLVGHATSVVALDPDSAQARAAKACCAHADNVSVVQADALSAPFTDASFDAVTSLAVIHHLPLEAAVFEMVRLLRPGGRLVLLGVWPDTSNPLDMAVSMVAVLLNRCYILLWGAAKMTSPTQTPAMPMHDARRALKCLLPGVMVTRRLLWRYTVSWTKPSGDIEILIEQ